MPTVRLTAFFRDDDGHGWTEAHDRDGGSSIVSLTPFLTAFNQLMLQLRRPMLAADAYYIGCRASYKTVDGKTAAANLLQDVALSGPKTVLTQNNEMDESPIACKVRFANDASTATSDVYLRGLPQYIVTAGQLDFSSGAGDSWKSKLNALTSALIAAGYGWVGVNPAATPRGEITGYTAQLDGTILFDVNTTNGVPMPTPSPGKTLYVNFQASRLNNSKSILNRTWVASIESPTTLKTVRQVEAAIFQSKGTFAVIQRGFIPYAVAQYNKLANRKTGKVFGVGRGRLPVRQLR